MHLSHVFFLTVASLSCAAPSDHPLSLFVDDTPTFVRPYIIPHLVGHLVSTDGTANRFPITAASSGGAFTLLSTNAARSSAINVPLHAHKRGYENFFCSKGIIQLWLAKGNDTQQVRMLEPGDMGASPPGITHAFQTMRPDTELFGVTFPGGLENMFYATGKKESFKSSAPYDVVTKPSGPPPGPPPQGVNLEQFDIVPVPGFVPLTDVGNGSAPLSPTWHLSPEPLPKDTGTPFYVGNDMAPKYLNSENGYTIISPLNTAPQSAPYNFTLSYLTLSKPKDVAAVPWRIFTDHGAFRVQDGALSLQVEGYGAAAQLLPGDVAFLPQGTKYKFHAIVPATKTLYVAAQGNGLDAILLRTAKPWEHASYPVNFT